MIYLIGSIIFSSYLTLSFKVLQRLNINTLHAIVFNYIACVFTGILINGAMPFNKVNVASPWFLYSILMGVMFITIFNVIGTTAQKLGVAVASVANKLSLVIPFLFSIFYFSERLSAFKIIGILIALVAVIFTCYPKSKSEADKKANFKILVLLPAVLFIGSGLIDTLIVFVQNSFFTQSSSNFNNFLIIAFAASACIGIVILLVQFITVKQTVSFKAILAGIIIGVPNYFSIWCLGKVIGAYQGNSSAIVPVNNMGIVLFSAGAAWILFKEKLTSLNWLGIIFAIIAIALIAFG